MARQGERFTGACEGGGTEPILADDDDPVLRNTFLWTTSVRGATVRRA